MTNSKLLTSLMMIVSLCLLIPGVTLPMITIKADLDQQTLLNEGKNIVQQQNLHPTIASLATQFLNGLKAKGTSKIYEKKRSILDTAEDLWKNGYYLLALLIVTFSLIVPTIKLNCLLLAAYLKKNYNLLRLNSLLSKWSMADVFAIGVLIAFLAANSSTVENTLLQFDATLHSGFYWFVAYSVVNNLMESLINSGASNKL